MVHEVTMDTVRIITSSVSGMTSVSWPAGLAHGPMAQVCAVRGCEGRTAQAQDSALLLLPVPQPGRMGGPRAFSCLSSFFKIHFLGATLLPSPGQCLAPGRPDTYHLTYCLKCIHHLKAPHSRGVCAHSHMYSVTQLCPIHCGPMDWSPPGSSAHRIFQARILEWSAISSSKRSSRPKDQTCLLHWQADSSPREPPGEPMHTHACVYVCECANK